MAPSLLAQCCRLGVEGGEQVVRHALLDGALVGHGQLDTSGVLLLRSGLRPLVRQQPLPKPLALAVTPRFVLARLDGSDHGHPLQARVV